MARPEEYIEAGLALIPIPAGKKGPIGKGWNLRSNAITDPASATGLEGNIGLAHAYCTPTPTMALDIDDYDKAVAWLAARGVDLGPLLEAPDAVQVLSGRLGRAKLIYRLPEGAEPFRTHQIKCSSSGKVILEFRCASADGKTVQDVLPPSVHPETGKPYQWGGRGDWRNIPVVCPELLALAQPLSLGDAGLIRRESRLPSAVAAPDTPEERERIQSWLSHISADCAYPTYCAVVWAILSLGWDDAIEIARTWCMSAPSSFEEESFQKVVGSFDLKRSPTAGTLHYLAGQGGWTGSSAGRSAGMAKLQSGPGQPLPNWSLHGDVRNADFFCQRYANELIYVPQQGTWMVWRDARWSHCRLGEEKEAAKATARELFARAGEALLSEPEKAGRWVKDATQAHQMPRLLAMLDLAKSDPRIVVSSDQLDASPRLLGVGNGVVDLKTGTLRPNAPDLYITRYCSADLDAAATCPTWQTFLHQVFEGDEATIGTARRLLGYTLMGSASEEVMIICQGRGANGKSIFNNTVFHILGGYALAAPTCLLAARRADDHGPRNDMAMLDGARMVSVNELPAGLTLNEQVVKQLAGREAISARFLNREFFTYQPRFTVWVRTNHKPIVKGEDDGIWRRLVILPFRRSFSPEEQDPRLEEKLRAEANGILGWMVHGAREYLSKGLVLGPALRAEQARYRRESDVLGDFLDECTNAAGDLREHQSRLYGGWSFWCQQNGLQPGSKKTFTQRLADRGFLDGKSNGKRYYLGLRLQQEVA